MSKTELLLKVKCSFK